MAAIIPSCLACGALCYVGPRSAHADDFICRACQRSPAVQMRVQLARARNRGMPFARAWPWACERVRWPHDTTHRREWKAALGIERPPGMSRGEFERNRVRQVAVWEAAYGRTLITPRERNLGQLDLVA